MNGPRFPGVFGWLVRDTFKQAAASGLGWAALVLTTVATMVCLSAETHGPKEFKGEDGEPAEILPADDIEAPKADKEKSVTVARNRLTLLFGRLEVPLSRDGVDAVRFFHYTLASGMAETLGVFLALIGTASFLPTFLQPSNVIVLLAKPTPRWLLLAGKYAGVMLFVALHATLFAVTTWTALGMRTGVWNTTYLTAVPLLLVQFASFFGFSAVLATVFRSTVVSALGALLCWAACLGVNAAHHAMVAGPAPVKSAMLAPSAPTKGAVKKEPEVIKEWLPPPLDAKPAKRAEKTLEARLREAGNDPATGLDRQPAPSGRIPGAAPKPTYNPSLVAVVKVCYTMLPKPLDFGYVIFDELKAGDFVAMPPHYESLKAQGAIDLRWSVLTSLAFAGFLLLAACQQFTSTDY
ncbi:MAG TPA: ABC transporter permease [Planctomycetia bacterium]|nr:ABC transporter permease [Planctomycetia bacterium]